MARNIGVNFNGKHIVHPGAYSTIDTSALGLNGSNTTRTIVFVGNSEGGQPGVVHWFANPSDAKNVLRGGDLMTAGELAWSPTGDGQGASQVGFLRVEDAKQASLKAGGLTITSKDYGDHVNKIQAKLEDGTIPGSKRLTVYFWVDNQYEVYDNIGPIFTVQYTGSQAYASLDIETDPTSGKAKSLKIKTGADAGSATVALNYDLTSGQFDLVQKLVQDINEHPDFTASMVTAGNKNIASVDLDGVLNQDIKTTYVVKAMRGDLLYQTRYSQLVNFSFDPTGEFPSNFGYTYLTGGSSGATPASWADKFNLLYGMGVDLIVPLTPLESIHAECAQFVEFQSNEELSEMIGLYGGSLGENLDTVIGRALTLNSSRAVLCYPGITRKLGSTDEVVTLPPYFTAALVAGCIAGSAIGDPVTLDFVNLIGLERIPTASEVSRLIESGVTTIEYVNHRNRKGFRIAQGITTYQADENPVYREISVRLVADSLNGELRERLESKFAGQKGTAASASLIKNEVQSYLDEKVRDGWIVDYQRNVEVLITGDQVYVTYQAQPVNSINYILITTKFYQEPITA